MGGHRPTAKNFVGATPHRRLILTIFFQQQNEQSFAFQRLVQP